MNAKTAEWRPGPSVCRCCLSEGCYKDISTEYFWMGRREVYAEMLSDTFDLTVAYSKSSGPNSNSRLICEPCIARLRDAADFKRQVQECERTFLQHLDPSASDIVLEVTAEPLEKAVKMEECEPVKEENAVSDDDIDDVPDFGDDDDDDLDDQPLTRLASKTPKKETMDISDLLDNAKAAEKRKSSTKTKGSPAKKAKTKKDKVIAKPKPEKKKKGESSHSLARRNAKTIISFATAYPFRLPESALMCVYCSESYPDPSLFRRHMDEEHRTFWLPAAFAHCTNTYLKVDITDLKCRVCKLGFSGLIEVAKHLVESHQKKIDYEDSLGLQPFKFNEDVFCCVICERHFPCIRLLSRHMSTHYQKYTCEECGKSYSTANSLQNHIRFSHIRDQHLCRRCKRTFNSLTERRVHLESTKDCWPYHCGRCHERFIRWPDKETHQIKAHGEDQKLFHCPECGKVFKTRKTYGQHFAVSHGGVNLVCSVCGKDFASSASLKRHSSVHV